MRAEEEEPEEVEIVLGGEIAEPGPDEIWSKTKSSAFWTEKKISSAKHAEVADGHYAPSVNVELTGSLLNSSAGGYCMAWLDAEVQGARIGELIGIYEGEHNIHLGVIRWLHHKAKFELVIGVELLSPVVEAVDIEIGVEGKNLHRALYFSANQKLGQPDCLLCAPGIFKGTRDLILNSKSGRRSFRLEKLLGTSLSFQFFVLTQPGLDEVEEPLDNPEQLPPGE
jgi:hypothetical protein